MSCVAPLSSEVERRALHAVPFDAIGTPGAYVCNWSGHLLRVSQDVLGPDRRPINIIGSAPLYVTKISDDPQIPVNRARALATAQQLEVRF